jgi:phospholipid transport system substrate-binding protein
MYRASRIITAAILLLATSSWNPPTATALTPAGQLQETWEQIVFILKSTSFDSEPEINVFRIKVMQIITPRFDFAEMARRCLGAHWGNRTREEREEYAELFVAMLARSYIGGIRDYKDSTVLYIREFNDANSTQIDTRIIANGAKDLFVSYKMHFVEEDWKVYDVIIDDVSLVDNYRSQFHRVIARSSFEGLIRIMRKGNRADMSD